MFDPVFPLTYDGSGADKLSAMRVCVLLLILCSVAITASGQSLADVARKEAERRQGVQASGKTYTDKDLKPVPGPAAAATAAEKPADEVRPAADDKADQKDAGAATDDTGTKPAEAAKTEVRDQDYWSKRMAALREQLDRDQTYLSALQNRIDSLTTDFVNRSDPAQQSLIFADRQKALAELDRLKKAVELDRRAIPDLEDEARREGVPPGWLR